MALRAEAQEVWPAAVSAGAAAPEVGCGAAEVAAEMWDACCRECRKRRGKLSPRSSCESPNLCAQPRDAFGGAPHKGSGSH